MKNPSDKKNCYDLIHHETYFTLTLASDRVSLFYSRLQNGRKKKKTERKTWDFGETLYKIHPSGSHIFTPPVFHILITNLLFRYILSGHRFCLALSKIMSYYSLNKHSFLAKKEKKRIS